MSDKKTETIAFRTTDKRKAWLEQYAERTRVSVSEQLNAMIDAVMEDRVIPEHEGASAVAARHWQDKYIALEAAIRLLICLQDAGELTEPINPKMLGLVLEANPKPEE